MIRNKLSVVARKKSSELLNIFKSAISFEFLKYNLYIKGNYGLRRQISGYGHYKRIWYFSMKFPVWISICAVSISTDVYKTG